MKNTLAETKRGILRNFDEEFQGMYSAEKKSVEVFLSTAIDQAWEDFKEVVKMEKLYNPKAKGFAEERMTMIEESDEAYDERIELIYKDKNSKFGFNQAINELQKRIDSYETNH